QIRNENADGTILGTPVVREIYGDILTNIYAIIKNAGLDFTETEDSETTQYQLLDALKVFFNKTNDLQQLLTVNALNINSAFSFDNMPENYVFIGKLTEDISAGVNYSLNSLGLSSTIATTNSNI